MQDRPENLLEAYYGDFFSKTKDKLIGRLEYEVLSKDDSDVLNIVEKNKHYLISECWKVKRPGKDRTYEFVIAFPQTFPDKLPKIYLTSESHLNLPLGTIPHLDKNWFLCTLDPDVVTFSEDKADQAIIELLDKATRLMDLGLSKSNKADFSEEFLAYWNDQSEVNMLSIVNIPKSVIILKRYKIASTIFGSNYVIAESKDQAIEWLFRVGTELHMEEEETDVLYVPLSNHVSVSIRTIRDVLKVLRGVRGRPERETISDYFSRDLPSYSVLSSLEINGEKILFGWRQPRWTSEAWKGFRPGSARLFFELLFTNSKNKQIEKNSVCRLDRERLFGRLGEKSLKDSHDLSATLIGCGAVGGNLAMALALSGVNKFLLIDNQTMEPENIVRHICSMNSAAKKLKKVEAIKQELISQLPDIQCNARNGDILQLLSSNSLSEINDQQCIIVCIGDLGVERRLNYWFKQNQIQHTMIFMWMEPFGVAGHILIQHSDQKGCFKCCFDHDGQFIYSVAKKQQKFRKREAGCQSSYIPFGANETQMFANIASKKILKHVKGVKKRNRLITWIGDTTEFEAKGFEVKDEFMADSEYSVCERVIEPNDECDLCRTQK